LRKEKEMIRIVHNALPKQPPIVIRLPRFKFKQVYNGRLQRYYRQAIVGYRSSEFLES
jgi:hypothetical protein